MKDLFVLSLVPLLAAASPIFGVDTIHNGAAPILSSSESKEISNSYIIIFKKDISTAKINEHHEWIQSQHDDVENQKLELRKRSQEPISIFGGLKHTFDIAGEVLGYAGHFDNDVIERVRRHPDVGIRFEHIIFRKRHIAHLTHLFYCPSNFHRSLDSRTFANLLCFNRIGRFHRERLGSQHYGNGARFRH